MLAVRYGRAAVRRAAGWTARHAGFVASRVTTALEETRKTVREQYQRGREENLARHADVPPPSARPEVRKTNGAPKSENGAKQDVAAE